MELVTPLDGVHLTADTVAPADGGTSYADATVRMLLTSDERTACSTNTRMTSLYLRPDGSHSLGTESHE